MDAIAAIGSGRIVLGLLVAAALHGQQPAVAAIDGDLRDPRSWMPLEPDSEWVWRSTWMGDDGIERNLEWRCVLGGEVPLLAKPGAPTARILRHSGKSARRVTYWSATSVGLQEYEGAMSDGGIRLDSAVTWLPAPVGATTRWEWQYEMPVQTLGATDGVRGPMVHCCAELLSLDEAVTVPAGEFRCAHVRVTSTAENFPAPVVHDRWFARGIGIVKETHSQIGDRVLLSFRRGPALPDAGLLVERWLRAHDLPAATTVRWLDLGDAASTVRGRFACVQTAASAPARLLHVDTEASEFHIDDLAFWQARSDEAAWPAAPGEVERVAGDLNSLCHIAALVAAGQRGWLSATSAALDSSSTTTRRDLLEDCRADVSGSTADGTKSTMRCTAERRGGKLTQLRVEAIDGPR